MEVRKQGNCGVVVTCECPLSRESWQHVGLVFRWCDMSNKEGISAFALIYALAHIGNAQVVFFSLERIA